MKKGLGSSQVSCLQPWSDPEAGIIFCIAVTKMTRQMAALGPQQKGTTLHNGSKRISALAPWAFCSSGQVQPSWHLVTLDASSSVPPEPCPDPTGLHPDPPPPHPKPSPPIPCPSPHTLSMLLTEWNQPAETSVFQRYFHRENNGQILTPALLLTQLSSPALKLYLSKAVPSFLQTGKLFQRI